MDMADYLDKIINYDEPFNISHTLFGYCLGLIGFLLDKKIIFELKSKFTMLQ